MVYAKRWRLGSDYGDAVGKNQELESFPADRWKQRMRLCSLLDIARIYETYQ